MIICVKSLVMQCKDEFGFEVASRGFDQLLP
jgi:hypothetical protein